MIYKGESANKLQHTVRQRNRQLALVHSSHLSFHNQISMSNIPSTPMDYCKEVGQGLTEEEAKSLARPRVLSPAQQELMSWHHRLYHLPFRAIFMLAKCGVLPKHLLECKDNVPKCVACQFGCAHRRPWRKKGRRVVLSENQNTKNLVMAVQLTKKSQHNLASFPKYLDS